MQNEFAAPAPGRYCRMQILAFLVLNLLGSCVHIPQQPEVKGGAPTQNSLLQDQQTTTPAANKL